MAVEYYVCRRRSNGDFKTVMTCETSAEAVREAAKLSKLHRPAKYCCVYSEDAIRKYEEARYVAQ